MNAHPSPALLGRHHVWCLLWGRCRWCSCSAGDDAGTVVAWWVALFQQPATMQQPAASLTLDGGGHDGLPMCFSGDNSDEPPDAGDPVAVVAWWTKQATRDRAAAKEPDDVDDVD